MHDVPLQTEKGIGEEQVADFFDSDYEQFDEDKVTKEAASRQQGRGTNSDYVASSSKGRKKVEVESNLSGQMMNE